MLKRVFIEFFENGFFNWVKIVEDLLLWLIEGVVVLLNWLSHGLVRLCFWKVDLDWPHTGAIPGKFLGLTFVDWGNTVFWLNLELLACGTDEDFAVC